MRALEAALMGLVLAVLVVGIALLPLLSPPFTRALSGRYSLAREAGLSPGRMRSLAEAARVFVTRRSAPALPATVDGRPGFDKSAADHLLDVRRVLEAARIGAVIAGVVTIVWVAFCFERRRVREMAAALFTGAAVCVAVVVGAAIAGSANFDAFFTWFHGLFFAAGTWEFPADALLIQVFPEAFWETAALAWATLVLLCACVLIALGLFARRAGGRLDGRFS